jgi:hypothetical protein
VIAARAVFLGLLGVSIAGAVGARRIAPERRTLLHVLAVVALLGIVFKAVLVKVPGSEAWLVSFQPFLYFERDLAVPFAVAFFAIAARLVPEERNRRALSLMPWILGIYLLAANAWLATTPQCYEKDDNFWWKGVCRQSTDFTCGAASCSTLLRLEGVDATEHECARLSYTIPDRGVTSLGAAIALRTKLPNRKVDIRPTSLDELAQRRLPCLAPIKYSFLCDHMIVVLGTDPRGFVIGDPLSGPVVKTREELAPVWLNEAITVE